MKSDFDPINLLELEELAKDRLSSMAFDYYVSGANDEQTLRENCQAFKRLFLSPRMLRDVSERRLKTTVLGQSIDMPIMIAPTAFHKLAHPQGELATARAAGASGTLMTLSTLATSSIEEVMQAASGPIWFQLYVYNDRQVVESLVKRAEQAGCTAIVLTVDTPMLGRRERDVRNNFRLPAGLTLANLIGAGYETLPQELGESGLAAYMAGLYNTSLSWKDVDWLKSITSLPLLVKGIMRADDALLAVEHGVAGIVVSNHGGRQLDGVPATITVLPEIIAAVAGKVDVYLDGGIRRGTDVLKALACGARAVFVGRPILWGLAVGGQSGVEAVLAMLRQELDLAMALSGCTDVQSIPADLIYAVKQYPA